MRAKGSKERSNVDYHLFPHFLSPSLPVFNFQRSMEEVQQFCKFLTSEEDIKQQHK